MCGIYGVWGIPNAAQLVHLGLYALQHRGQESAGIVSIDAEGHTHAHRSMGLVQEIFTPEMLQRLPGDIAIGHTRYSTTGGSAISNAQPCLVNYHAGPLVLAHNGNLTNAATLRDDLVRTGSIFQSSSDSEVLVHLIARSEARRVEDQILDALERVEGAYSLIMLVGRTLYAICDPRGFRPLVLARLGDGYVLGSETCAMDIVGATVVREFQPGEWLKISDEGVEWMPSLPKNSPTRCVFELIYFSRPDSVVFGESVDRARRDLGRRLAIEHPAPGADCVFSVPDSANAMALGYAEESGLKLEHGLIRNHYIGRTFISPTQDTRTEKAKIKFNPVRDVVAGKSVVVVDDSLVRGTTSKSLIRMIRQVGAREIHLRIASPPIIGPCYYGIDTPTREELIAANHSVETIQEHLEVDSLGYLSLDGVHQAINGGRSGFCDACFSGRYPTALPEQRRDASRYPEHPVPAALP
jgi:amidophosphoribosyltransferase